MTNEFKVGQSVSGHDYDNLPLGAQVTLGDNWFTHTKISGNRWRNDIGRVEPSGKYRSVARTLAHLPEPEDETDAYVEPEPLKEGDAEVTASAAIAQMANAIHDFAAGFEKAGEIFWREMKRLQGGAS
jgi:hypothetical protein